MKLKLALFIAVLAFTAGTMAQSLNLRFSTYFYGWQRIDSLSNESSAKTTHIRGYQNLLLDFSGSKWGFSTLASTEEDLANKPDSIDGFRYRLYNAYIKGTNLFNRLDVKLGRQYLFAGVGKGTIDGLYFKVKAGKNKEYQLALYGGSVTPLTYDFDNYPSIKDNYMFGAQFNFFGVKGLTAGLSYTHKKTAPASYTALRLDSLYNTTTREITFDGPAEQLAGLDFNYSYDNKHFFFGKLYYDIGMKKLYRGEFNARINAANNLRVSAGYTYRQPQITFNSIFWVFAGTHRTQEIEGGVDYTLKNGMNIFGRVGALLYEKTVTGSLQLSEDPENQSLKIQAGVNHPSFGLNFIRYMGYGGESDGVYGYYQRQLMENKLSTSLSLSYSRYRLGEYEAEKVNSLAGALGFTFRPVPQFSVDVQGQMLINRIYKTDVRVLVGLNYWLFKNFK